MTGGIFLLQDSELVEMREQPYGSESVLQELLEKYPRLLTSEHQGSSGWGWLLVRREVGVPDQASGANRWSIDHLFVDATSVPTLVEVKRSSDSRIRRELIGQMLDYAANGVVYWPAGSMRSGFEKRCAEDDEDAEDVFTRSLGTDLGYDDYWKRVDENLRSGRIRLVFVADDIPRELRRVIEFLNEQMVQAEVIGVEIKQYRGEGDTTTLVPRVVGQTEQARRQKEPAAAPSVTMTWGDYKASLRPEQYEVARELFDRIERYRAHENLPWRPVFKGGYFGFQRPGGYYVVGVNLRKDEPNQFWVKLPHDLNTLQSAGEPAADPYPQLGAKWDARNHQIFWRIPNMGTVPDVASAIELSRKYQPASGPMPSLVSGQGP
jgi:hypothetical protein